MVLTFGPVAASVLEKLKKNRAGDFDLRGGKTVAGAVRMSKVGITVLRDAIHQQILPLPGYVPVQSFAEIEIIRKARTSV